MNATDKPSKPHRYEVTYLLEVSGGAFEMIYLDITAFTAEDAVTQSRYEIMRRSEATILRFQKRKPEPCSVAPWTEERVRQRVGGRL